MSHILCDDQSRLISCISPQVPFRREKESSFYMQNLNKILSLLLHLSRVWRPSPAEERLHNHFLTQKTVTTSPGSWHHSQSSSLLNVTEWVSQLVSQSVSDKHNQWSDSGPIKKYELKETSPKLDLIDALDVHSWLFCEFAILAFGILMVYFEIR